MSLPLHIKFGTVYILVRYEIIIVFVVFCEQIQNGTILCEFFVLIPFRYLMNCGRYTQFLEKLTQFKFSRTLERC